MDSSWIIIQKKTPRSERITSTLGIFSKKRNTTTNKSKNSNNWNVINRNKARIDVGVPTTPEDDKKLHTQDNNDQNAKPNHDRAESMEPCKISAINFNDFGEIIIK